jgi:DNA-binding HxlR family transcriptional regulator
MCKCSVYTAHMAADPLCPRSHCPIAFSLDILGDRWTLVVLRDLVIKRMRLFRELLDAEESIATNILTDRLRRLEAWGIVTRRPDPDNARQVIYEPTPKGLDLIPVMVELARWGATHDPQTAAPRGFVQRAARQREAVVAEIRAAHRDVDHPPVPRRRKPKEPRYAP